jgi:hypothetical protein
MTRIRNYLLRDEIDRSQISHEKIKGKSILFENTTLGWSENESEKTLKK